jgi:hypothetical protein
MFCNSITNALNLENIDIEGRNIRHRSSTISKIDIDSARYQRNIDIEVQNFDIVYSDIEENVDIEVQNFDIVISRYRRFLDIDKCYFDIFLRCRSFFIRYRMS